MEKFVVKIDMSMFFNDERRLVLILIDPNWENVSMLAKRVKEIFDVEGGIKFLTSDDYYISPNEPIEILKFVDVLKAFQTKKSNLEKKPRKSKKSQQNKTYEFGSTSSIVASPEDIESSQPLEVQPCEEELVRKRKYYQLGNTVISSTPATSKRSKNESIPTINNSDNKSDEITSTKENVSKKELVESRSLPFITNKNKKKIKQKSGSATQLNSHIYYNDSAEIVTTTSKTIGKTPSSSPKETKESEKQKPSNNTVIIFESVMNNLDKTKPRIFPIKLNRNLKPELIIQEQIIIKPVETVFSTNTTEETNIKLQNSVNGTESEESDVIDLIDTDSNIMC